MAAAATSPSKPSLTQSKSSLSLKTHQNPSLSRLNTLSFPPKLSLLPKKGNAFVAKCSMPVNESFPPSSMVGSNNNNNNNKEMKNPIIVIDNYDSFTYNLCQDASYRNDELTVEELKRKNPRGVLISPGQGVPQDSGISLQIVLELGPLVPLFCVSMGLQCIGEAFGAKFVRSPDGVMHGKSSLAYYDEKGEDGLLFGLQNSFTSGRYHSLVIENDSFPNEELEITAWTEDGLIMAARHKKYKAQMHNA